MRRHITFCVLAVLVLGVPSVAAAAELYISPSSGVFDVGKTFSVSIYADTKGQSVNAVAIQLQFPPDRLQMVSPSAGQSVVGVWTMPPIFNNSAGTLRLEGGIPGGFTSDHGLISTVSFRVYRGGTAFVSFAPDSKLLLNDGKGTNALSGTRGGEFALKALPLAGPEVSSPTHPDEARWYNNNTALLSWKSSDATEFSYSLSDNANDPPDNISEGQRTSVEYRNISSGTHYFHIKAMKNGAWGGVTNYALNVDTDPPARFNLKIIPGGVTVIRSNTVQFFTSDALSGIDHYEYKVVPLSSSDSDEGQLFVEGSSPVVVPDLLPGKYSIIVRAYDKAGNFRETTGMLNIVVPPFQAVTGEGMRIFNKFTVPWPWFFTSLAAVLILLFGVAWRLGRWRAEIVRVHAEKRLPQETDQKLAELKEMMGKYSKHLLILLTAIAALALPFAGRAAEGRLDPPIITSLSGNISTEDSFYVQGAVNQPEADISVYIQNVRSGGVEVKHVTATKRGDWFYRSDYRLSEGEYIVWAQSNMGEETSVPSPQEKITVSRVALEIAGAKVSYEMLYLIISAIFFLAILGLIGYMIFSAYSGKRRRKVFLREVREVEESIKRGFAVLHRDIVSELEEVKRRGVSAAETEKEKKLLEDLALVRKHLEKEVWQMEKAKI